MVGRAPRDDRSAPSNPNALMSDESMHYVTVAPGKQAFEPIVCAIGLLLEYPDHRASTEYSANQAVTQHAFCAGRQVASGGTPTRWRYGKPQYVKPDTISSARDWAELGRTCGQRAH